MNRQLKIAGVQMDIALADVDENLARMEASLRETTVAGADLTVFPECTVTGYCFDSLEHARSVAQPLSGPVVNRVQHLCAQLDTRTIFGMLELDGDQVFNALVLVDKSGIQGSYRKVHLPHLGVDRFTTPGNRGFRVFELPDIRIGMIICYDSSFPEAARVLAIQGADLVCLPTNWPPTSGLTANFIPNARALENHIYFMAINRVGVEGCFEFIGKSKICDPRGVELASADHNRPAILYADIDPQFARQKHLVNIPGVHEVHRMEDRRPDVYGPISQRR